MLYQAKYRVESSRLRDWDYRSPGWYFVTICAQNRTCIFGDITNRQVALSAEGKLADSELQNLRQHYDHVHVDTSVVMPNHICGCHD